MVTIGINNKITFSEAARYIGCSRSNITKAVKSNKIKVYRFEGHNFLDQSEVAQAKESGLIKGKIQTQKLTELTARSFKMNEKPSPYVKVQIEIEKSEFELLSLALSYNKKSMNEFINGHVKALTAKVKTALTEL